MEGRGGGGGVTFVQGRKLVHGKFCQTPTRLGTQSEQTWTGWVRSWLCFPMSQQEEEQDWAALMSKPIALFWKFEKFVFN